MRELATAAGALGIIALNHDHPQHNSMRSVIAWALVLLVFVYLVYHMDEVVAAGDQFMRALLFLPSRVVPIKGD